MPHGSIGTIRARSHLTLVSLSVRPAAAQSVVSSSRIILATLPLFIPRLPCPHNISHPLQISSAVTTVLAGRSARAPSVSSSKVCFFCLSPRPFLQPGPVFLRQGRTFSTPRPLPSNLSVYICLGAVHRPNPTPIQEPRKAEAPQLRDECRSYRILAGCRQCNAVFH